MASSDFLSMLNLQCVWGTEMGLDDNAFFRRLYHVVDDSDTMFATLVARKEAFAYEAYLRVMESVLGLPRTQ